MHIPLDRFCEIVKQADKSNAEKALGLLWYFDQDDIDVKKSAGELTRLLVDYHLGTPNQNLASQGNSKDKAGE